MQVSDEDQRDDDERDESADESAGEGGDEGGARDDASEPVASSPSASDEDGAEGEDDGDAVSSTSTTSATQAPTGGKPQRLSAGARLAAAKAAKAATKAAKKQARRDEAGASQSAAEREAEDRARTQSAEDVLKESPLGRAATRAGEWTQANRQLAMGVAGLAAAALIGWIGWTWYTTSQATAAGTLLSEALRISSAEIVAADEEPADEPPADASDDDEGDEAPHFATIEERNVAALEAYRRVTSQYGGSVAANWARLGEGRTLLGQGEYGDARTAYQAAFDASGDESVIAWQALEGIGATYEAEQDWEHATATYERLASLADHAYESVANYHLARMRAASGDEAAALSSFRELVDTLREEGDEGEPPFPYVLSQADQRLRELDPSAQGAGPSIHGGDGGEGGEGGGIDSLTPEQIQELIQRLQTKGGGSGGAPLPE